MKIAVSDLKLDTQIRQRWKGRQLQVKPSPHQLAIAMIRKASSRGSLLETVRIFRKHTLLCLANVPQFQLHPFQPIQARLNLAGRKEAQLSWKLSSPAHLMALLSVFRRARPLIPRIVEDLPAVQRQAYANGLFAAPWATQPAYFPPQPLPPAIDNYAYYPGIDITYAPAARVPRGPTQVDLMNRIREVAVFAWALTGINGSLADYAVGKPAAESQPPDGVPIWSPRHSGNEVPPYSGSANDFIPRRDIFGDPGQ